MVFDGDAGLTGALLVPLGLFFGLVRYVYEFALFVGVDVCGPNPMKGFASAYVAICSYSRSALVNSQAKLLSLDSGS